MQSQRGGRCIVATHLQPSTRRWVVSTMFRLLYPRERPSTHCTRVRVGLAAGLESTENLGLTVIQSLMAQPIASHYSYHAKPATISRATLWSNVYTNIIMFFVRYKHHITKQCDLYYCPKVMKYFREQLTVEP